MIFCLPNQGLQTYLDNSDEGMFGRKYKMNTKTIFAAILITVGIVVLAYSGVTFKTPGKPVDFLGIHIATTESHFVPPAAGALALVGGIVLLVVKPRSV